ANPFPYTTLFRSEVVDGQPPLVLLGQREGRAGDRLGDAEAAPEPLHERRPAGAEVPRQQDEVARLGHAGDRRGELPRLLDRARAGDERRGPGRHGTGAIVMRTRGRLPTIASPARPGRGLVEA